MDNHNEVPLLADDDCIYYAELFRICTCPGEDPGPAKAYTFDGRQITEDIAKRDKGANWGDIRCRS